MNAKVIELADIGGAEGIVTLGGWWFWSWLTLDQPLWILTGTLEDGYQYWRTRLCLSRPQLPS